MPLRLPGAPDPNAAPELRARRPGQEALEWLSQIFGGPESIAGLAGPIGLVGYKALGQTSPDLIEALRRLVAIKKLHRTIDPSEGLSLARAQSEWATQVPRVMDVRAALPELADQAAFSPSFLPTLRGTGTAESGIPASVAARQFPELELVPVPQRLEDLLEELARVRVGGGGEAPAMPHTIAGQKRLRADIVRAWLKGARGAERQEIRDMAELPLEHWQRIFPLTHELRTP